MVIENRDAEVRLPRMNYCVTSDKISKLLVPQCPQL